MTYLDDRIAIYAPDQCSPEDRAAFVTLAAKGEEVNRRDIERGVGRAELLLAMRGDSYLVAVAAIKNPFPSYKRDVFRKAGVPAEADNFSLELGYLFVEEAHRRNGYGPQLVKKAIAPQGGAPIFATTRSNNERMHEILQENGFVQIGSDYPSKRDPSRYLRLFVRQASNLRSAGG